MVYTYNIYMYVHIHVSSQTTVTTRIWLSFKNEVLCNATFCSVDINYRHLFISYRSASFSGIFFIPMHLDLFKSPTDEHLNSPRLLILILVFQ